jgi:hypothetical protein
MEGNYYVLWIATKGPISPDTGQVVNLQTMDQLIRTHILTRFAQRNLSEDPAFANIPITDSALAQITWEILRPHFHASTLYQISVSRQPGAVACFSA